jgi:putative membrane protein
MKRLIVRLLINAVALYVAIALLRNYIFPQSDNWLSYIWLALIFGVVNAIIRPILMAVSCPFLILTLGLGTLVINTAMFALAGAVGNAFHVGFTTDGFIGAFLGALVTSVVSFVLSVIFRGELKR